MTIVSTRIDWKAGIPGRWPGSRSRAAAKYAAEFNVPNLAYGVAVRERDRQGPHQEHRSERRARRARRPRGVRPRQSARASPPRARNIRTRRPRPARHSARSTTRISSLPRQPIALVVAEEFEIASYAATLVVIEYESGGGGHRHRHANRARLTNLKEKANGGHDASRGSRGDADKALSLIAGQGRSTRISHADRAS